MAKRKQSVDEIFEAIGNRAIQEADEVDATIAEYQDGLRTIISLAQLALQASRETSGDKEEN